MSTNERLKFLFEMSIRNPRSIIRGNLRLIEKRLNMRMSDVLSNGARKLKDLHKSELTESDIVALDFIKQLRNVIFFNDFIPGFDHSELMDILHFVCADSLPVM